MKKVMIWGHWGTGDHISVTLPLARTLARQGNIVHGVFHNLNAYRLMRETSCFDTCFMLPNYYAEDYEDEFSMSQTFSDMAQLFPRYEAVYATSHAVYHLIREVADTSLLSNFVKLNYADSTTSTVSRTKFTLGEFGQEGCDEDIKLDIDMYKDYYLDFDCKGNSVLLNSVAKGTFRTYHRHNEVKETLLREGFDVKELDYNVDIRKNMHLVHQVKYILTTDTVVVWMAKALGKTPYVFLSEGMGRFGPSKEFDLGVSNIVSWYHNINQIPPQEIVDGFIKAIS